VKNYIVIGDQRYGFHTGSTFQIARRFAAMDYRVAWISYFLSPFHFFGARDWNDFRARRATWRKGGINFANGRIWSYTPFTLLPIVDMPFLRSEWIMDHSDRMTFPRLSKVMARNGFDRAEILWVDSSRYSFALDRIPHAKSVFRPSEDITLIPDVAPSFLRMEKELIERADVVLAHSRTLIESYRKLSRREIVFFPNAVDIDFFRAAPSAPPEEYRAIPPPRAVVLGGLSNPLLFDQDLIAHLARVLPDVSFVLIGRIYADVSKLRGLPNVHLLGPRPHASVPAYLKSANAGIVPYRKCVHSERVGGDMLKLFEYAACGLPIVSMDFKEFERFEAPVILARDYNTFTEGLRWALAGNDRSNLVAFAEANSWSLRFAELEKHLGLDGHGPDPAGRIGGLVSRPAVRPKVALIHPRIQTGGGSEACVLRIIEALKDGYDLTLITSNRVRFDELNAFYRTGLGPKDVRTVRVAPPLVLRSGRWFAALRGYRLSSYCKDAAADYDLMFSAYNPMDFGRPGIQYLLDPLFNTHLLRMLNPTPKKWLRWFYRDSVFRRAYLGLGERLSSYSSAAVRQNVTVVDSDWMGGLTRSALHLETRTLYPPVPNDVQGKPWNEREDGFLCVGRIVPEKQVERAVRIVAAVRREHPDVHLHVVGRVGDRAYFRGLKRLARSLGDWVEFETDVPAPRKAELLASHKYGIHGKENEPFGITIAELVNAGCLVWVPSGGGQVEIVAHEALTYSGIEDGASRILSVLADEDRQAGLRAHLAERAGNFSVERFERDVREIVAGFIASHERVSS
jgi:glycosyltransferase involved in cell wall biosynthesis